MALIVLQHSVVDNFDTDPTVTITSSNRILAGQLVGLTASGYLAKPDATAIGSGGVFPLGIAGDGMSDEYQLTPYSDDLVVSPGRLSGGNYYAGRRYTSPRVSDYFNETLASGKMTVYFGNGKFATDQYHIGQTFLPGQPVYSDSNGKFSNVAGSNGLGRQVGYVAAGATAYPSGVPGVDSPAVANSMSLGTYLTVLLSI